MQDMVLELVARLMIPVVQLFGMYVLFHGHVSPGGGFSGGTIIGASLVFYSLVFRHMEKKRHRMEHDTSMLLESGGALLYVGVGLLGMLFGFNFLTNRGVFPLGQPGRLWSSGMIAILTLGIGAKVAGTVFTLFQELLEGEAEVDEPH